MNLLIAVLATCLISYLIGGIPSAFVICKIAKGVDIREVGSGNVGSTNVFRTFGWRLALLTAAVDVSKGFIPVIMTAYLLPVGVRDWFMVLAAIFSVLGHSYSPMLKLSGGKGIATSTGALAVMTPVSILFVVTIFFLAIFMSKKVSLGSLLAAALYPLTVFIFYPGRPVILGFSLLLAVILFWRHKSNISRLMNGTESKIDFGKKLESKGEI